MGALADAKWEALASCSGFSVQASDGRVGEVETPLFPPDRSEPDYLVVRAAGPLRGRRRVVATLFVEEVDPARRLVCLRGTRDEIANLPEHLPLAT
jgi:hypothetical protein